MQAGPSNEERAKAAEPAAGADEAGGTTPADSARFDGEGCVEGRALRSDQGTDSGTHLEKVLQTEEDGFVELAAAALKVREHVSRLRGVLEVMGNLWGGRSPMLGEWEMQRLQFRNTSLKRTLYESVARIMLPLQDWAIFA